MYTHQFRCQPAGGASQGSYDAALSFLKHLNSQELQSLMDDNNQLNKLVEDLEIVKNLEQEKETLLTSNKSIAEYNLTLEPRLIHSRQQLAETYEQAIKVQKDFESYKLKLDSCVSSTSLDTTLALLQMEAAKAEDESEKAAEMFLSQPSDVEKFMNDYTALRTTAHLRKVKVEKLEEMVKQQAQPQPASLMNSFAPSVPSRAAPVPPYPSAASVPGYPGASALPPYPPMGQNNWAQPVSYPGYPMPTPAAYLPR